MLLVNIVLFLQLCPVGHYLEHSHLIFTNFSTKAFLTIYFLNINIIKLKIIYKKKQILRPNQQLSIHDLVKISPSCYFTYNWI